MDAGKIRTTAVHAETMSSRIASPLKTWRATTAVAGSEEGFPLAEVDNMGALEREGDLLNAKTARWRLDPRVGNLVCENFLRGLEAIRERDRFNTALSSARSLRFPASNRKGDPCNALPNSNKPRSERVKISRAEALLYP